MNVEVVNLSWSEGCNIIIGQTHFIKSVEDLAEIAVSSVPGIEFGLAFSEASGPCLIRTEGNATDLIADAVRCAQAVGAGHSFFMLIRLAFPINLLNAIKACPEVCQVFCATANPVQVVVARTDRGAAILGVVDGSAPRGVEGPKDKEDRRELLRRFGYKY